MNQCTLLSVVLFVALMAALQFPVEGGSCQGQPIPYRYDGFAYGSCFEDAPVLEAFMDLQCPDSKAAWKALRQVLADSDSDQRLCFIWHHLPLPYHTNSFLAAMAANAFASLKGPSHFFKAADLLFDLQANFSSPASSTKSPDDMLQFFADAVGGLGVSTGEVVDLLKKGKINMDVRVSWKFGVTRGAYGTPYFLLNGVPAADPSAGWSAEDWRAYLKPYA